MADRVAPPACAARTGWRRGARPGREVGDIHSAGRAAVGQRVSSLDLIRGHIVEVERREGDVVDTFALLRAEARENTLLAERRDDPPFPLPTSQGSS